MITLKIGDSAPDFKAKNQDGKDISLSDFKGKKLILFFYPKDNTPGCTAESCNLSNNYDTLKEMGFNILGVSPDSEISHQKFIKKFGLSFELIADTEKIVLKKYEVWGEKKMFGKIKEGVFRTTFIIDENGLIERIIKKVKTKDHAQQIIDEYPS